MKRELYFYWKLLLVVCCYLFILSGNAQAPDVISNLNATLFAVDGSGNLYARSITAGDIYDEEISYGIKQINPNSNVVVDLVNPLLTSARTPELARDNNGNFYILDLNLTTLTKRTSNGTISQINFGDSFIPKKITCDTLGNLYVLGTNYSSGFLVRKITPDGTLSTVVAPGIFNTEQGLCTDSIGNIYVMNIIWPAFQYSILKISPDGSYTTIAGNEILNSLRVMTSDADGNLYVVTTANSADFLISKLTVQGNFTTLFSEGLPQYDSPSAIAIDAAGAVYLSYDWPTEGRILKFAAIGCTPTTSSETVTASNNYTWSENNTTYNASGIYTNVVGCNTATLNLTIVTLSVSSVPTNLVATPMNTSGAIAFTAPTSDGGSAITNYEYSINNGESWVTPYPTITASPLIISGLTNCTSYQVKLRAVNAVGASTASEAILLTPLFSNVAGIDWISRAITPSNNNWSSVVYGNGLFVSVGYNGTGNRVMTSPDGITWTLRASAADSNNWKSVTYGDGLFVAVSASGIGNRVMTSPDGITWTSRTSAVDSNWESVTYGNGLFVALALSGVGNRVMTSPDGVTWTGRTAAVDSNWQSVTYGNGLFVAVAYNGSGNRVMTSPDGITWTSRTSAADNNWYSVTYGNGLFVSVAFTGAGNGVMTSPDGITWTIRSSASSIAWRSVAYGNGLFVAVASSGTGNRVMTSPDGINWTGRTSAVDNSFNCVAYGNGLFVAVAQSNIGTRLMTSGLSVIPEPPVISSVNPRNTAALVAFSTISSESGTPITNYEYAINNGSWISRNPSSNLSPMQISNLSNGTTYTIKIRAVNLAGSSCESVALSVTPSLGTVADAPTNLVVTPITTGGMIQFTSSIYDGGSNITNYEYSINNGDWVSSTPAITASPLIISGGLTNCTSYQIKLRAVNAVGNGAASDAATLTPSVSNFGTDWTIRLSAADQTWNSITYGNGLFVAVASSGEDNRIMTSPDGISWTSRTPAANIPWTSITYGNNLFVAVANSGSGKRVMTSSDGITWTSRISAADNNWKGITYGNGLFVAVADSGTGNRVMTSPDGVIWTLRTSAANNNWQSVTYGNGLFVAVAFTGTGNRVMTSPDGITWTSRTSATNNNWWSITYGNGLFVAVAISGTGNRVMTSPDGITWTSRTSAADDTWYSVTYGNGLFVAVKSFGTNFVMTSSDGIEWSLKNSAAANNWNSVTYGNGLFVAVAGSGTGNRVMTSSFSVVADAPVITSATLGASTSVNFTQSSSASAPAITNYEYSTENGSNWTAVSPATITSPLTITGLATAPSSIMIRAVNTVGTSCPSTNYSVCVPTTTTETITACDSYTWNGTTYATTGIYTGTTTNCITEKLDLTITPQAVEPTITVVGATTFCSGGSVVLTSSLGSSYLWSTGATTQSITVSSAGSYSVRVTNASGCQSAFSAATIVTVTNQTIWYTDADNDSYPSSDATVESCMRPTNGKLLSELITGTVDCNDSDGAIHPGVAEVNFDGIDNNCSGSIYEGHALVVVDITTPSGILPTMGSTVTCSIATNNTPYSGASVRYKFKVTKTNAPTSVAYITCNSASFAFSSASNAAHSSTYDVRATAIVNEEEQPYNGNTISYTTQAVPTLSNPTTQTGLPNVACAYTLAKINSYIYANNSITYGANRYEFLIERMNGATVEQTLTVATTLPYFRLTDIAGAPTTMQVTYGTAYRISVRYGYGATSFGSLLYTAYGAPCLVSTPALPVASVATCGATLASINSFIYVNGQAGGANQFEYLITRVSPQQPGELPISVTSETLTRNVANFRLTMLTSLFVGLQKEYSISVRYRITAFGMDHYSAWSVACPLRTPEFPETQIVEGQCGVEGVPSSINQYIYADAVAGATQYRFRLYNAVDFPYNATAPYDHSVYSPDKYVRLRDFPGLLAGVDYSVTVVAQLYGEYANINLAKDCSVIAPQSTPSGPAKAVVTSGFQATAYPNPFANNFMIAVKTGSQSVVNLKVYDMIGRLIEQREVTVSDIETTTIGDKYPSGIYKVVVAQEENVHTVRVVKR